MNIQHWQSATDEEILAADLLIELNLAELPAPEQAQLLTTLSQSVEQAVLTKIVGQLTPEQRQELEPLVNQENAAAVQEYLEKVIPNLAEIYESEMVRFKRLMLTGKVPVK